KMLLIYIVGRFINLLLLVYSVINERFIKDIPYKDLYSLIDGLQNIQFH
ncbi:unnamed protein product, partial [marine sediment metagenome]